MRPFFTFLLAFAAFSAMSQASSGSHFQVCIHFDPSISVSEIVPHYLPYSGNTVEGTYENIHYEVDAAANSMTLSGYNSYILWAPFPALVFTLNYEEVLPVPVDRVDKTYSFYLISGGPLSSYTGEQTREIFFSYDYATIIASLQIHNHDNAFEKMKIERLATGSGYSNQISLGNEMIRIKPMSID